MVMKNNKIQVTHTIQVDERGSFIVLFGGEVDPSERGHEGAGGFANDIVMINEDTLEVEHMTEGASCGFPLARGWSDCDTSENEGRQTIMIFGGLSGTDQNPMRLNDLWICTIAVTN